MRAQLDLAVACAKNAGHWLRSQLDHSALPAEDSRDVKMVADRKAEEIIIKGLHASSSFPILSEETGAEENVNSAETLWIVDPLDGTANYWREIPICAVSIALWKSNHPILGVVYDFQNDTTYSALVGEGMWQNGALTRVSKTTRATDGIVAGGMPLGFPDRPGAFEEYVKSLMRFKKMRMFGSAALSLSYLAVGRIDAYTEDGIALWDVAAGLALVTAAGGAVRMSTLYSRWRLNVRAAATESILGELT